MSNAIHNISAALGYDAVETAILGSFAEACRVAAAQYANAPVGEATAPESCRTVYAVAVSSEPATVRPAKR